MTLRVVIVDDSPFVRELLRAGLARHADIEIVGEAGDGKTAERLVAQLRPDVVTMDVVMPLMDGPTMVRQARKTRPDLPILFMSGYAEEQLRKSIDIANVAFLPKPFSVQELAEAVRKALSDK